MSIDFAASEKAVNQFSRRVMRRVAAAGISDITLDDVKQECWAAWCKARDAYDVESGVPFIAYLRRGMMTHVNRWLVGYERNNTVSPVSLNKRIGDDGEDELGDIIAVSDDEPLDFFAHEQILAQLSDRARQFVTLLANPPRELFRQVDLISERAAFGRARGLTTVGLKSVNMTLIMELMGAERPERVRILREIRNLTAEINQC